MKKSQMTLFERAVAFGLSKPEAEFHVKFHEVTLRSALRGFRRERSHRCKKCTTLLRGLRRYCEEHEFTETLGFNFKAWEVEQKMV